MATETRRGPEPPDISERGGIKNGEPQRSNDRLFMQLVAFGGCTDSAALAAVVARSGLDAALYEDINDPRGVIKRIIVVTAPAGAESVEDELEFTIEHRMLPGSEPKS